VQSVYYGLAFLAGACVAVQVAVNGHLRSNVPNPMQATVISFTVGTLLAAAWCLVGRYPPPDFGVLLRQPWWAWLGGVLGVVWIWSSIVIGPKIGVAPLFCVAVAAQILVGTLIDAFGWFRTAPQPIPPMRVVGVGLVILGVVAVTASKE
jgi:transporter family-2 protein